MTLQNAACNGIAGFGQGDAAVVAHVDITVFAQTLHCKTDGRLGYAQMRGDVYGAGGAVLFAKNEDRLKIILSGFVDIHGKSSLYRISYHSFWILSMFVLTYNRNMG